LPDPRRATGRAAEALAVEHLRALGYAIVATNWRTRFGEIDVVARDRDTVVVVEVRSRRTAAFGSAADSVGPRKRQRLVRMAEAYLQQHAPRANARIDVVTVDGGRVEHLIGAVDAH
jgi:putative endonuclease